MQTEGKEYRRNRRHLLDVPEPVPTRSLLNTFYISVEFFRPFLGKQVLSEIGKLPFCIISSRWYFYCWFLPCSVRIIVLNLIQLRALGRLKQTPRKYCFGNFFYSITMRTVLYDLTKGKAKRKHNYVNSNASRWEHKMEHVLSSILTSLFYIYTKQIKKDLRQAGPSTPAQLINHQPLSFICNNSEKLSYFISTYH